MDDDRSVLEEAKHRDPRQVWVSKTRTAPGTPEPEAQQPEDPTELEGQQQHGAQARATRSGAREALGSWSKGKPP